MILSLLIFFTSILISKLSQLQQEIATVYQLSAPYDVIHHREVLPSAQSPSLALHAISSVIKSMSSNNIYYIQIHHSTPQTMLNQYLYYTIQYLEPNTKSWGVVTTPPPW